MAYQKCLMIPASTVSEEAKKFGVSEDAVRDAFRSGDFLNESVSLKEWLIANGHLAEEEREKDELYEF